MEWHERGIHYDIVYMSKVFTFTPCITYPVFADKVIKGGTGYFYPDGGQELSYEMEHIFPDYELYSIKDTAYGFLTRGCPRGCSFCIVGHKEGVKSYKVANLTEFWNGQRNVEIMDPNLLACKEHENLLHQLIESKSVININQGMDCRLLTERNISLINQIKVKTIHFAWDRYRDKDIILPKLQLFKNMTGWDRRKLIVYVLVNFDSTFEEDLERVYTLRKMGCWPYVMVYEKDKLPRGHRIKKLQRWVNNRIIWESIETFEKYLIAKI